MRFSEKIKQVDDTRKNNTFSKKLGYAILLGPGWFKHSGYGCGYGNLWMRTVAVSSGFKRFVRLLQRLKICAFAGDL